MINSTKMKRPNGFQKSMVTNDGYFGTNREKRFPATGKRKKIAGESSSGPVQQEWLAGVASQRQVDFTDRQTLLLGDSCCC